MTKLSYYAQAVRRRLDRRWFDWRCRGVRQTAPIHPDDASPVVVVSQLYSPDVIMYLLAAKSFALHVRPRGFVIVDDGLTADDRATLNRHLGKVRYVPSAEVRSSACPKGGCWERLLSLSAENRHHYVVQLDSDTLTIARPTEVMDCIAAGRSFTLGTPTGTHVVPAAEAAAWAAADPDEHVQNHCERALARLAAAATTKYVRGCAGFTGFAPGQLSLDRIEAAAEEFGRLIGKERFARWGSEQVVSNLMAANAPDSVVLPVDRYPFWAPRLRLDQVSLVHFFGMFRYTEGMYIGQSRRVISELAARG
jgi:hypothetical protein